MDKPERHICEGKIWDGWRYLGCSRTAKWEHNGLWFCKTHHPPTVDAKQAASAAAWRAKFDAAEAVRNAKLDKQKELERKAAAFDEILNAYNVSNQDKFERVVYSVLYEFTHP